MDFAKCVFKSKEISGHLTEHLPVRISLTNGGFAIVDYDDYEKVSKFKWYSYKRHGNTYAKSTKRKSLHLHQLIMPLKKEGSGVDHFNGNGLDNRKANLRYATKRQNAANRDSCSENGFKGVRRNSTNSWQAVLCLAIDKTQYLGSYNSPGIAAAVYDMAHRIYAGNFARTNFGAVIERDKLADFLEAAGMNGFFSVGFMKRTDGRHRYITCRLGVSKGIKGKGLAFDPSDKGLLSVYDVHKRQYRFLPLENIVWITIRKKKYLVLPIPEVSLKSTNSGTLFARTAMQDSSPLPGQKLQQA